MALRLQALRAALIAAVVGVSGCTAQHPHVQETQTPDPPVVAPSSVRTPGTPESSATASPQVAADPLALQRGASDAFGPLPLEAYGQSASERYSLETTVDALADRCMSEFGFAATTPVRSLEDVLVEERESRNRLFGVVDVDQARVSGYLPASVVRANAADPDPPQSEAFSFVLTGVRDRDSPEDQTESPGEVDGKAIPPNGCLGQAREQVYGTNSSMMPFVLAPNLRKEAWFAAQQDPRVRGADEEWKQCMAARGFSRNSVWDDNDQFLDTPEPERPTELERQMAVADAECNNSVGYVQAYYKVLVELENVVIEKNQLALTEERQAIEASLTRANELAKDN